MLIRDDIKAGAYLNKKLKGMPFDFKQAQCYYYGNPIKMAFCYSHYEELGTGYGYQALISIAAEPDFKFSRKILKNGLAYFFNNRKMNCIRLEALTPLRNEQALRLVKVAGFTVEGVKRRFLPNDDVVISSMLKEEFHHGYIQRSKSTSST